MLKYRDKLRICLVASAGGHLSELLRIKDSWDKYDSFCLTTSDVVREELQEYGKVYVVGECNRQQPFKVMVVLARCARAVFRERPDILISTGAAVGCIACFLSKLIGAKIIWMDSITNVERISLSGRMVRYIADLFLVQWPEFNEQYNNVEYVGEVI
jgi:UDP-N-acetylglucosamine:LPS N-acetylglucosamine transferase